MPRFLRKITRSIRGYAQGYSSVMHR